jgi:glycosyltransferase involved in cell wall biosynthesis
MKLDITAIILTKNEQKNLKDCILSIENHVQRIVVIDSYSDDETIQIAKMLNVDVFQNQYQYYAQQFNWGIHNTNIDTKWILRIDADERFTIDLWNEIGKILKQEDNNISGISIEAWLYFLNKKMRYGLSNKRKIMLFKKEYGTIENIKRDAHTIVYSGDIVTCKNKFIHFDSKGISKYIERYNMYSSFELDDYKANNIERSYTIHKDKKIASKRKLKYQFYYKFPIFIRAKLWYIWNYYFKLGFLDGRESKIYHMLECFWYRYLVDVKLFEERKIEK